MTTKGLAPNRILLLVVLWCTAGIGQAAEPRVLFDQGHGQRFLIENAGDLDLSLWAEDLRAAGIQVSSTREALDTLRLQDFTALIVSGPFEAFSASERQQVLAYLEDGGALLILLHVGPINGRLLADLGVGVSNGVVLDSDESGAYSTDFVAEKLSSEHPLTRGLDKVAFYGVWALRPATRGQALVRARPQAWMDLNRNRQRENTEPAAPFSLAVAGAKGSGEYIILGDDAVFQNRFYQRNQGLARNLVVWLQGLAGSDEVR